MRTLLAVAALLAFGCATATPSTPGASAAAPATAASAAAERIVDDYLSRLFARDPEAGTALGWPAADHGAVTDVSPEAIARWRAYEDEVSARLGAVDPRSLTERARLGRLIVLEAVDSSRGVRVCRYELSDVSPFWGWQANAVELAEAQPVGSPEKRAQALSRLRGYARMVDVRIANLREGLRQGRAASRENVAGTVEAVDALLATPPEKSPFARPAVRDGDPAFLAEVASAVSGELTPALKRYRRFLAEEYTPRARPLPGVGGQPDGAACYRAAVRRFVTLDVPPATVHETGLAELARTRAEMTAIAERSFGTRDLPALLKRLRSEPRLLYASSEEIIATAQAAIDRAWAAAPRWFARLPKARVRVQPYPEFQRAAAPADAYSHPTEGGGGQGVFWINAFVPPSRSRAGLESTVFHETVPGHHLQIALAAETADVPAGRWLSNSAYVEGWALYTERLAREMGLFTADVDLLGQLSEESLRAARLVVDSGIHAFGWSRKRAIEVMLESTTLGPEAAASEVDRYAAVPGQAVAYDLGAIEIRKLRAEAEKALGARFDIRAFHAVLLGAGPLPLAALRERVEAWVAAGGGAPGAP